MLSFKWRINVPSEFANKKTPRILNEGGVFLISPERTVPKVAVTSPFDSESKWDNEVTELVDGIKE